MGFRVEGLGFGLWGLGLRAWGVGFRVQGLGFGVSGCRAPLRLFWSSIEPSQIPCDGKPGSGTLSPRT